MRDILLCKYLQMLFRNVRVYMSISFKNFDFFLYTTQQAVRIALKTIVYKQSLSKYMFKFTYHDDHRLLER